MLLMCVPYSVLFWIVMPRYWEVDMFFYGLSVESVIIAIDISASWEWQVTALTLMKSRVLFTFPPSRHLKSSCSIAWSWMQVMNWYLVHVSYADSWLRKRRWGASHLCTQARWMNQGLSLVEHPIIDLNMASPSSMHQHHLFSVLEEPWSFVVESSPDAIVDMRKN